MELKCTLLALILLLVVNSAILQPEYITEMGDGSMDETRVQSYVESLENGEITQCEFWDIIVEMAAGLDKDAQRKLVIKLRNISGMPISLLSEEEQEAEKIRWEEARKTTAEYVIRGDFIPAANDIDLETIARFVFTTHSGIEGTALVLDKMHGMVYYDSRTSNVDMFEFIEFSAEFIDEDLVRLIEAIEASGLRDWEERFSPDLSGYDKEELELIVGSGRSWRLGILFSDGTMLRRSGGAPAGVEQFAQCHDQFEILSSFVRTLGEEIEERHHAEIKQTHENGHVLNMPNPQ